MPHSPLGGPDSSGRSAPVVFVAAPTKKFLCSPYGKTTFADEHRLADPNPEFALSQRWHPLVAADTKLATLDFGVDQTDIA